jgi:hypothetical protein
MPKLVNLEGKRFGALFVMDIITNRKKGYVYWKCRCDCGKEIDARGSSLISGGIRSCGCLQKKRAWESNSLPPKLASLRSLYRKYKKSASDRKYSFNLDIEYFKKLTSSNCYYCGIEPYRINNNRTKRENEHYVYNGIDRIDNSIGYEIENCVPCCRECNVSKGERTTEEFINWIKRVHNFSVKDF